MKKIAQQLYCKCRRRWLIKSLPAVTSIFKLTRPLRKRRSKIGIYTAYFNSSVFFEPHLNSLERNTRNTFDYYVMKNFSARTESEKFDYIVSRHPAVHVFKSAAGRIPCPMTHGDSLQRMISMTDNEIVIICDIDTLFVLDGWDNFVLKELETKRVVAVMAHFKPRNKNGEIPLVLHPSFMAFRRDWFESNGLDVLAGEGNDPAYKITKHLLETNRFDQSAVCPIIAKTVDYANGWYPKAEAFNLVGQASHGFCTHYSFFFHFWHSRNYAERSDIIADTGNILVPYDIVKQKVDYYIKDYIDNRRVT